MIGMKGNPFMKREMGPVEAVLTLAYEQRTANLIAMVKYCEGDEYEQQIAEINASLGRHS